jgi:hypothetical protein
MQSFSYYSARRLEKFTRDQQAGANCGEPNYNCRINPKSGRCKAFLGSDEESEHCECIDDRCKKISKGKSERRVRHPKSSPVDEEHKKDEHTARKSVTSVEKKKRRRKKRSKRQSVSKPKPKPKPKSKSKSKSKPLLKRADSDSNTSAWEKVLEEYRSQGESIDTPERHEQAFQRYLELMRVPMDYYAGNAEIVAVAQGLDISVTIVQRDSEGEYYVINGGIINDVNGRVRGRNIYIYYNGIDHYESFVPVPDSHPEEGQEIIGEIRRIAPDGDCLYNSILAGLRRHTWGVELLELHDIRNSQNLRMFVTEIMNLYKDHYINFFYPEG